VSQCAAVVFAAAVGRQQQQYGPKGKQLQRFSRQGIKGVTSSRPGCEQLSWAMTAGAARIMHRRIAVPSMDCVALRLHVAGLQVGQESWVGSEAYPTR
jgi:hypothetical protein